MCNLFAVYLDPLIWQADIRVLQERPQTFKRIDNQSGYVVDEANCKWQQVRGYSLGRWAFWKERLDVIAMAQG